MKILSLIFAIALSIVSLGCEMHPLSQETGDRAKEAPKPSAELQKALRPEPANPDPPSFFPTPQPQ